MRRNSLKNLAVRMEKSCAEAVCASARQGAAHARQMVPVDSGELKQSICVQEHGLQAAVSAKAGHAVMVEYGTSRMPARPFMLPMAREMRSVFIRNIRTAVQEVIH